jgi:hypothetical protein
VDDVYEIGSGTVTEIAAGAELYVESSRGDQGTVTTRFSNFPSPAQLGQIANGTEAYLYGSNLPYTDEVGNPIGKLGSIYRWRLVFNKSAAGIAAWAITIRIGRLLTLPSDVSLSTFPFTSQTAVADTGWADIELEVTAIGVNSGYNATIHFAHGLTTTGLYTQQVVVSNTTKAFTDGSVPNEQFGLSLSPGASGVFTVQSISAELHNAMPRVGLPKSMTSAASRQ